jgi:RNA polymerase sigma-70 factor, ECF subfamily
MAPPIRDEAISYDESHEEALLRAVRSGDRVAAEAMVDRTYGTVYASLYKMCGDADLAADLTQETFQKAWVALPRFDGRSQLSTWLYRIAYTTFLNHIRRPHRLTSLDDENAVEPRDSAPAADEVLSETEEAARLRAVILRLSDDLQFTVTAHFWAGLPVKEIARIEKISTVAVRKRLHKAFGILETLLNENEDET